MKSPVVFVLLTLLTFAPPTIAERINQEGRILGPLPLVISPILFNTSNADAVVSAMQIFPVTNPWNEDVSQRPVLTNSDAMMTQIIYDLTNGNASASYQKLHVNYEMNFVLVPDNQPHVPIDFFNYPDESDLDGGTDPIGLYPIPVNLPVEPWPLGLIADGYDSETLQQWQTNTDIDDDRHAIMAAPGSGFIWETWETLLDGTNWMASNGAKFDLNSNGLRPAGWTSGDAAGLPMFPALVRYDEAERGTVEHALRVTVKRSRNTYIYPATHFASSQSGINYPAMGQRLRLKAGFVIPGSWTKEEKAVALGLKKYGAMVADNGSVFGISVSPDDRWPGGGDCFNHLLNVGITNFEVLQTTGANEGPRSPGAPVANAGPDQTVPVNVPVTLRGVVTFSNTPPTIQWELYSGPGTVTFVNATLTNTTATFSAPGIYTLELSAADGIHAISYDAAVFTAASSINLSIALSETNVDLNWTGGTAPFVVQETDTLPTSLWSDVVTINAQSVSLPMTNAIEFFRIQSQ